MLWSCSIFANIAQILTSVLIRTSEQFLPRKQFGSASTVHDVLTFENSGQKTSKTGGCGLCFTRRCRKTLSTAGWLLGDTANSLCHIHNKTGAKRRCAAVTRQEKGVGCGEGYFIFNFLHSQFLHLHPPSTRSSSFPSRFRWSICIFDFNVRFHF